MATKAKTPGETMNGLRDLLRHAPQGTVVAERLRDALHTITVLMTRQQVLEIEVATLRDQYDSTLEGEQSGDREIHRLLDLVGEALAALTEPDAPMGEAIERAVASLRRCSPQRAMAVRDAD